MKSQTKRKLRSQLITVLFYSIVLVVTSCHEQPYTVPPQDKVQHSAKNLSIPLADSLKAELEEEKDLDAKIASETITCYVVIADTSTNYYLLRDQMFALHKNLKQPIDTMRRTYNATKDLIALPDNDADEVYAGDYFPRRYPTDALSLEYLNVYKPNASETSIALVTGMYTDQREADSALNILKKQSSAAFVVKSDIYMGCMH